MALIHRATLEPSKLELLTAWLPRQGWYGGTGELRQLGAYRFDDPAGEVGLEAFLLTDDSGITWHVPLTYRGTPLEGAEEALVGTTEHSVLGTRHVYDGAVDPVWRAAATEAIRTGGTQVEELVDVDGELVPRDPSARVQGSGAGDLADDLEDGAELVVVREVGTEPDLRATLTGEWSGDSGRVLAGLR